MVAFYEDYKIEEVFIPEKEILIKDFGKKEERYDTNHWLLKEEKNGDHYAWRMFGYDAQNTGYYPFPLYPPFQFRWRSNWPGWGHALVTEISGCAGHGKLFIGGGLASLYVVDLETGQILWQFGTTSNTMTSSLCYGESLLFVGCLIGFNPESPTFYAIDPFTGRVRWRKALRTVQFPPLIVDSFVYVRPLAGRVFCFNLRGDSVWSQPGGGYNFVWWEGKIYYPSSPHILDCRNALTGDSIWRFVVPNETAEIADLTICDEKVFFFTGFRHRDTLWAVNTQNGTLALKIPTLDAWIVRAFDSGKKIFKPDNRWVGDSIVGALFCFSAQSGSIIWQETLRTRRRNGGAVQPPTNTPNGIVWASNLDFLYLLNRDNGEIIEAVELPSANTWEQSFYFPIIYKNYLIGAHRDFVYVYKGDTTGRIEERVIISNIPKFYHYTDAKNIFFSLSLISDDNISVRLFDIRGNFLGYLYKGFLNKGKHILSFNFERFSSGIYLVILETSKIKKVVKILYIK